jgi:hypothetical protein
MPIRKRFNRDLYNANDMPAKDKVKELLKDSGYKIVDNTKKTGIDLFLFKDGKHILSIETEIKRVWNSAEFPYESVNIPERKSKYLSLERPTVFVMFNNDLSSYLVIRGTDVEKSPKREVPNKYVYKGELFYQIDLTKIVTNDILSVIKEIDNEQ